MSLSSDIEFIFIALFPDLPNYATQYFQLSSTHNKIHNTSIGPKSMLAQAQRCIHLNIQYSFYYRKRTHGSKCIIVECLARDLCSSFMYVGLYREST